MIKVKRYSGNPILKPSKRAWEKEAVFNPSVVKDGKAYHMVYRAIGEEQIYHHVNLRLNTIGYAKSKDGKKFGNKKQLITPKHSWEHYGCEDPRVTKLDGKYYILYTALSDYPHSAAGIKVGLAVTSDFKKIEKKRLISHFNSKAASLFPEKINGKITMMITINTDIPPSKIAIASFPAEEAMWSDSYWENWLKTIDDSTLSLLREGNDHVEAGAPPVKTEKGWLVLYSYIKNYKNPPPTFGIEAVLLDLENPLKIIGRTKEPLLVPQADYETSGAVHNIVFPTGALVEGDILKIYYGASDNYICLAETSLKDLLDEMLTVGREPVKLTRYKWNPIITPRPTSNWESKFTFNPAAVYEGGRVHIVYRAMNDEYKSVLGYASSEDGEHFDERLSDPIYTSREDTQKKIDPIYHSCEDPRITKIKDKLYMCYTAFDGKTPTVVSLTSIKVRDFLDHKWNWETPRIISDPVRSDKNTCILPEKIKGNYIFFHRLEHKIWLDSFKDLKFVGGRWLDGEPMMHPREESWDSQKVGIAGPPIKTEEGWLLIYHGLSKHDKKYRLSAALLGLENPGKVLARLEYPILEPETDYENVGDRPGTVFGCGNVIIADKLYIYYGAADQVVAVASCTMNDLLSALIAAKTASNN